MIYLLKLTSSYYIHSITGPCLFLGRVFSLHLSFLPTVPTGLEKFFRSSTWLWVNLLKQAMEKALKIPNFQIRSAASQADQNEGQKADLSPLSGTSLWELRVGVGVNGLLHIISVVYLHGGRGKLESLSCRRI
jgi:hypothetical protein